MSFVVPPRWFSEKIETSIYCRDDRIYWIDSEGHVHIFAYQGRLIDGVDGRDE
jgi:hypothetical protein